MPSASGKSGTSITLAELPEPMRKRTLDRCHKLRPHPEQESAAAAVAEEASLPFRTAQRWVSRYRQFGLAGFARATNMLRVAETSEAPSLAARVAGLCMTEIANCDPTRIRQCARAECSLLFYDMTRNRCARWHAEERWGWRSRDQRRRAP